MFGNLYTLSAVSSTNILMDTNVDKHAFTVLTPLHARIQAEVNSCSRPRDTFVLTYMVHTTK